ncbi:MAG: hypothetical protein RLY86_1996 [Pseudomonadota bacterium]|jgi:diguanylate cyclase (GGDEF)-like protein/PAS domain S-box-containing protein
MILLDLLDERYRLAGLSSGEAIWDWDADAGRLFLSPGFRALLGLGPADDGTTLDSWFGQVHPEDRPWLEATLRPQPGDPVGPLLIEHRVRAKAAGPEAPWRWLLVRGSALTGPDGGLQRMAGTAIDITDRKAAEEQLRLSEQRLALAAAATNDGLYDWDLRTDRIYYGQRWAALIGLAEGTIGDRPEEWLDRVHPEDVIWLQATLDAQVSAGGRPFQIEYRIRHSTGGWRWMLCRGIAVPDGEGEPVRIVGSQSDITDRKLAEEALRQSEERYALAARGANDGLWDWRLDAGNIYFSARWAEMVGWTGGERTGIIDDWYALVHPEDVAKLRAAIDLHLTGAADHLEHECRIRHTGGGDLWVLIRGVAILDADGTAVRMAGSMTDITARKRAEQQLLYDAFHDGLTGLPNRALLLDRIGQVLRRRQGGKTADCAVLLFDLDLFKTVNDSLGPFVGDHVLTVTAERLEQRRRPDDTVARISADEFAVLAAGIDNAEAALSLASSLAAALAEPITLPDGQPTVITASAGITLANSGYAQAADMLRDAGLAVYRAKAAGRNRAELFDDALRARALHRLRLESDLRAVVESGGFTLFYQPIVRLDDLRIAGFEALIRWHHPERGSIAPVEFIPLAEETGLILPIGRWALDVALHQLARWRTEHGRDLFMSVNVSPKQMHDPLLADALRQALADSGVPAASVKLELTESMLMDAPDRMVDLMEALRAQGVRLSLDDFGTGFSSLSYLHRFPFDVLKIDRSFVQATGSGTRRAEIARIITLLAKALDLEVVAEGIETETEMRFMADLDCRYGQGYRFSPPLPADAIGVLLRQGR